MSTIAAKSEAAIQSEAPATVTLEKFGAVSSRVLDADGKPGEKKDLGDLKPKK